MRRSLGGARGCALVIVVGGGALLPASAVAGDGTFPAERRFEVGAGDGPFEVAVGDFNADGDQDIAIANGGADTVTIRPGGPGATFPDASAFTFAGGDIPHAIAVGDFNQDGDDDLAIANQGSANVTIRPGGPGATFPDASAFPHGTGLQPLDVVLGSFNGDNDEDIATANSNSASSTVRYGGAGATFPGNFNLAAGTGADSLAVGDFDQDGAQDLVIANLVADSVTVRPGDGLGNFPIGEAATLTGIEEPDAIAVGDFSGDGDDDLAIANNSSSGGFIGVTIRPGGSGATFPADAERTIALPGSLPLGIAAGDLDSDGHDDLAVADAADDAVTILRDAPNFRPSFRSSVEVGNFPEGVALGDFDADGNIDLATPNFGSGDDVSIRPGGGPPALAGNLLSNGGFEGDGAARLFDPGPPAPPGWQRTGSMTYAIYGMPAGRNFPARLLAPRLGGGQNLLYSGGDDGATAFQTVTFPRSAKRAIKAGRASVTLSAQLGGSLFEPEGMEAKVELLRGSGSRLRVIELGPVTPTQRRLRTTLLPRAKTKPVPKRARRARVTLTVVGEGDDFDFAFADNVKLTLDKGCGGRRSTLVGTTAAETLRGRGRPDVIAGSFGDDRLIGRGAADRLCGGRDDDKLKGGAGDDLLFGDAGRDKLSGGRGRDVCIGRGGRDKASGCEVERSVP